MFPPARSGSAWLKQKRAIQLIVVPPAETLYSCMACNNAAWVLGGVRFISSASTILAKTGPLDKAKEAPAGFHIVLNDISADDVGGHQIWCKLDAD